MSICNKKKWERWVVRYKAKLVLRKYWELNCEKTHSPVVDALVSQSSKMIYMYMKVNELVDLFTFIYILHSLLYYTILYYWTWNIEYRIRFQIIFLMKSIGLFNWSTGQSINLLPQGLRSCFRTREHRRWWSRFLSC